MRDGVGGAIFLGAQAVQDKAAGGARFISELAVVNGNNFNFLDASDRLAWFL